MLGGPDTNSRGPDQDKELTFQDVGERTSSLKLSYHLESTLVFV